MCSAFALLALITGQLLLAANGVQGERFFAVGERIDGDQLLLKDMQHSRPGSDNMPTSVIFNYNIAEPITYIEIISEENISADVQFSYSESLIVGIVRLVELNDSFNVENLNEDVDVESIEDAPREFDVIIRIFGFNHTRPNFDPALVLNHGTQYKGVLVPHQQAEELIDEDYTEGPHIEDNTDIQLIDKIIEIGERQEGDDLIYETIQTSALDGPGNHSVVFYYIDRNYITYIKFVIFDHFINRINSTEYTAPVAEYSHYSPSTLKATITDYNVKSLFAQMFMYGYRGPAAAPSHFKPFLAAPDLERGPPSTLNALQREQLRLLMAGATQSPRSEDDDDDDDNDDDDDEEEEEEQKSARIRAEEMVPAISTESRSIASGEQRTIEQRVYAMLGLMLFAVA